MIDYTCHYWLNTAFRRFFNLNTFFTFKISFCSPQNLRLHRISSPLYGRLTMSKLYLSNKHNKCEEHGFHRGVGLVSDNKSQFQHRILVS